jgi:choline dehydrogenase-like flavoprotein
MIRDPIREGIASGWKVTDASRVQSDLALEADVAIIGSGAGGGVAAEILANAGLAVLIIEEGPLKSSGDFNLREAEAYPQLYQDSAGRKTRDKAITILQGRCVGGSTTINWTTSFRTPPATLAYWEKQFGLKECSAATLAPWFETMERRLSIAPWTIPPNQNNDALRRGAAKLGIPTGSIRRNVKDCADLGYCGVGCPIDAKQSMLVTTIPAALTLGARLICGARVEKLLIDGSRVTGLECRAMDERGVWPRGYRIHINARYVVLAAGAIGSPGILLRSQAPDPHQLTGTRTFLHPTVISSALMPERVEGYAGAPQSVYSDHFLATHPIDGPIGYKLEVPPLHPLLFGSTLQGYGEPHAALMRQFPHAQVLLALLRDGFHQQSQGGKVRLRKDGSAELDYPITDFVWDGVRRALLSMAEIQFAAGAKSAGPVHELGARYTSWPEARAAIEKLPLKPLIARVVSAHVMGGCAMGTDAKSSVVNAYGMHHQIENLSVFDGSVFPTSLGANPQLSIYGLTARNASRLAEQLGGRPGPRLA